jgi:hypothetical protein
MAGPGRRASHTNHAATRRSPRAGIACIRLRSFPSVRERIAAYRAVRCENPNAVRVARCWP